MATFASGSKVAMNGEDRPGSQHVASPDGPADPREDLVRRVVCSATFEKSPKLRAFLQYVCRCALENQPEAATEQQIGIYVFGRTPGYNPSEDNIVRSQARLLRLKLEHHFGNEGKNEPVVITIPKGRYVPVFEKRFEQREGPPLHLVTERPTKPLRYRRFAVLVAVAAVLGIAVWVASMVLRRKEHLSVPAPSSVSDQDQAVANLPSHANQAAALGPNGEILIAAGNMGSPYTDSEGRRWDADRFYGGGVAKDGPRDLFPPVPDADLFRTIREGGSMELVTSQTQSEFRYDIPVPPGVYELRLYFADPVRRTRVETLQDAQNVRHFDVRVNGSPLLTSFDATADAGLAAVDVRAFKDIAPASDGRIHLEFIPDPQRPFVSALELTPGAPGKMKPIRLSAHSFDFVDDNGTRWSADKYFIGGRQMTYSNPAIGRKGPPFYAEEHYGNFSYAIPVPPGSYTVTLHFLESFFTPSTPPSGLCQGAGCRVFDVTCNGVLLLKDFDVFQAAGGGLRPAVRTFHNLHPNGQGKLLLSFSPRVNYAEVRAIEVVDETP
jgi:hypothetical protein